MIHLRARSLLAALPDGTLPARLEARVRAHAAGCRRCQRILADYAALDGLLRSLPASLVPAAPSPASESALARLSRWASPPRGPWFERLPVHPIGAVATALALLLAVFLLTPPFEIETAEPFNAVVMASAHPLRPERPHRPALVVNAVPRDHTGERIILIPVAMR
ncbi:MAG: zf-HC2 domain-containing protein [Deltaproteobacteria bacterium]|nr:zf-HC2 domain-containing protein [Deltaproteobacteria bacterium]